MRLKIQNQLLEWYKENHRRLPWRETRDPYKIWISEIMLQQTQVSTVIDYFNRFIKVYPDVYALAEAEEDDVLKLWEGLGYYTRARKMMLCARVIVQEHYGAFPKDYEKVLKLPGIGPYTAGAVLSIAYNMPLPAVDGNVMRVISRLFNMQEDISVPNTRKVFEERVKSILPKDRRHFNQALMELGAVICTPQNPKCDICPVKESCQANALQLQKHLPVKTKKIKKKNEKMALAYVKYKNKVLLVKRENEGLLAGLWGFPIASYKDDEQGFSIIQEALSEQYGLSTKQIGEKSRAKHVFTHLIWEMTLYEFEASNTPFIDFPKVQWVEESEITLYPLPTAFKKLL